MSDHSDDMYYDEPDERDGYAAPYSSNRSKSLRVHKQVIHLLPRGVKNLLITAETEKAVLFRADDKEFWIAKSLIVEPFDENDPMNTVLNIWKGFELTFVKPKDDIPSPPQEQPTRRMYGVVKPSQKSSPTDGTFSEMLELLTRLVDKSGNCSLVERPSGLYCETHGFSDPCPHKKAKNLIWKFTGHVDDNESEIPF